MKKITAKGLRIFGLILIFGNPLLLVFISYLFPDASGSVGMDACFLFDSIGAVLLTLAVAKKRMENGTVRATGLLRALTPAQISLILTLLFSMVLMAVVIAGYIEIMRLSILVEVGFLVSAGLAVYGAIKKRELHKEAPAAACAPVITDAIWTGERLKIKVACCICEKSFDKNEMFFVDERYYCKTCFQKTFPS